MQTVDNFLDSLKSERTKEQYAFHLKRFTRYEKVSDKTPGTQIVDYLMQMKKEGLSSSYRNIALAAIKHYYTMNDVVLNWKKIAKFIGEPKFDNQISASSFGITSIAPTAFMVRRKSCLRNHGMVGLKRNERFRVQVRSFTDF